MKAHNQTDSHLLILQRRIASLPIDPALAREALRVEMENYSENHWAASWLIGLEFELWRQVLEIREHGAMVARPEAYACMLLAEIAGGWWYWPDEPHIEDGAYSPRFIDMQGWLVRYDKHSGRQASK
jgi:hypothetical protein